MSRVEFVKFILRNLQLTRRWLNPTATRKGPFRRTLADLLREAGDGIPFNKHFAGGSFSLSAKQEPTKDCALVPFTCRKCSPFPQLN